MNKNSNCGGKKIMKKSYFGILLLIVAFAMTFSNLAICADPCGYICDDEKVGNIEYCSSIEGAPECSCTYFDYESGDGYCEGTNTHSEAGAIGLKLCDCENVANINSAEKYSFKVTILTNGVYWAPINPSVAATPVDVAFCAISSYTDEDDYCANVDAIVKLSQICRFQSATGATIGSDGCADGGGVTGYNLGIGNCELSLDVEDRAVSFSTKPEVIFETLRPYVRLDLPAMYYDNTIVNVGDVVKVKVEITQSSGVCPDCNIYCVCEAVVLGTFGCFNAQCTLIFPYVLANADGWWTGIVITNKTAYSGSVSFTFYDQTNNTATLVLPVESYGILTTVIENLLLQAVGDTFDLSSPIQFTAITDFKSSGYCIIGGGFGIYGYAAENTCCSCYK